MYGSVAAYSCWSVAWSGAFEAGGSTDQCLELQATLAGGVGQRLDATVVAVTRTVERDPFDAGGARLLRDRLADPGGGLDVLAVLQALADVGLGGAGGSQDLRAVGAEQLGIQVLAGAQHRQARHAQFADVREGRLGAAQAGNLLFHGLWSPEAESRLGLLGFLADDVFAGVLDALALVRLRRAEAADLGGNLADLLPVGAADHDLGLRRGGDGDAFRRRVQHRVREAQRQVQVLALHGGTVTHADQLELALETLGHALDHVGHDRAQGSGQRHQLDVAGRQGGDAVLDLDLDAFGLCDRQVALRALDADAVGLDVDLDALGDGDRLL